LVDDFEGRIGAEVRRQVEKRKVEDRRVELPGRYMAKLLYGWDDRKFEAEYLRKLEKNWQRWKSVSPEEKP